MLGKKADFYTAKHVALVAILILVYLVLSYFLVGFKTDQLFLSGLFAAAYFLSPISRKFIIGFSIFIVYWIVFDYMKAFPNYQFNTVHIGDLYNLEKHWFGIELNGAVVTPNEYWLHHSTSVLDVVTGFFYLCWIPVPLAFAAFLFFTDSNRFLHFCLTFFFVNLLGFVIYYIYPAAPPWYYQLHGTDWIANTPGNTAGLARFDAYFNVEIFKGLYAKSSNVFAAMPSLHSAYPLIVVYYALQKRTHWLFILFANLVMVGIWFSAIYSSHHYVMDVLAGISVAILGILLYHFGWMKMGWYQRFIGNYQKLIER